MLLVIGPLLILVLVAVIRRSIMDFSYVGISIENPYQGELSSMLLIKFVIISWSFLVIVRFPVLLWFFLSDRVLCLAKSCYRQPLWISVHFFLFTYFIDFFLVSGSDQQWRPVSLLQILITTELSLILIPPNHFFVRV